MITYKDIRMAINQQLSKTGVEINSRDVMEGFNRPSFFVQLTNVERSGELSQVHRSMTVQIYYFPSDRYEYSIEVLEMQEVLEELFDLKLRVCDRALNVEEFRVFVNDGVLNCLFDIEFSDARKLEYNTAIVVIDEESYPIIAFDREGLPVEIKFDEDGQPFIVEEEEFDEEGNQIGYAEIVEVQTDNFGEPLLDDNGRVMPIRKMKVLDYIKGVT